MDKTASRDTWTKAKRTMDKDHWKWVVRKRRAEFEDAIFGAFNGFYKEGAKLSYDDSHLDALIDTWGWAGDFALDVKEWKEGKRPEHLRAVLKIFLVWGKGRFLHAKTNFVPGMPSFAEFLKTKPWSKKPVKGKLRS